MSDFSRPVFADHVQVTGRLLEPFLYQDNRWCVNCGGERLFIAVEEFEGGRKGYCLGCEQEKEVLFTRTTGGELMARKTLADVKVLAPLSCLHCDKQLPETARIELYQAYVVVECPRCYCMTPFKVEQMV